MHTTFAEEIPLIKSEMLDISKLQHSNYQNFFLILGLSTVNHILASYHSKFYQGKNTGTVHAYPARLIFHKLRSTYCLILR